MAPWARRLSRRGIESAASRLLLQYQAEFGVIEEPPVPVDEIIERFLGFTLEFADLGGAAHGATNLEGRIVTIDESLDPVEHPAMEGRCNFTAAHEVAHIVLHRETGGFQMPPPGAGSGFIQTEEEFERQADRFASYLLMPRRLVLPTYKKVYGSTDPLVIRPEAEKAGVANFGSREAFLRAAKEFHSQPLASVFKVSVDAMRIRLEELNLLPRS